MEAEVAINFTIVHFINTANMKTARQIIESKPPHNNFVNGSALVFEALQVMKRENLSYVIIKEEDTFMGIVGEKEYAQKVELEGKVAKKTLAKDIVCQNTPIITADYTSDRCLVTMNMFKTRYLPVFEDYKFIGVVTMHDLLREALKEKSNSKELVLSDF